MDVDLAVPEPLAPPTVSVAASAPHLRVSATVATRAAADLYEVETAVRVSGRARRAWRVSTLVPSATMPEIAAAAGFDPAWALPDEGDVVTTVKVYE